MLDMGQKSVFEGGNVDVTAFVFCGLMGFSLVDSFFLVWKVWNIFRVISILYDYEKIIVNYIAKYSCIR